MQEKIVQIIPATGWHALYASPEESRESGKPSVYSRRLVCWALIRDEVSSEVAGMVQIEGGAIERADLVDEFGKSFSGPFPFTEKAAKGDVYLGDAFLAYAMTETLGQEKLAWANKVAESMKALGWPVEEVR